MLWVALELPELPLQLLERASESAPPLVVTEGPSQRPIVACANDAAQVSGVREGMIAAAGPGRFASLRPSRQAAGVKPSSGLPAGPRSSRPRSRWSPPASSSRSPAAFVSSGAWASCSPR
jgi:hypothetical protein